MSGREVSFAFLMRVGCTLGWKKDEEKVSFGEQPEHKNCLLFKLNYGFDCLVKIFVSFFAVILKQEGIIGFLQWLELPVL